ncbi:hypothetical protein HBI42_226090 [Parastagonospora nodorum]|nr:hypothetical protein HBI47_240250 [Parastagonospora nodorum]KAH6201504.1 hypothetical protein HBI43_218870 [Parastagonospora nodorum]KAH6242907.1 hypothetical protein HBI42_226090 [Parastagonospora nodorum]
MLVLPRPASPTPAQMVRSHHALDAPASREPRATPDAPASSPRPATHHQSHAAGTRCDRRMTRAERLVPAVDCDNHQRHASSLTPFPLFMSSSAEMVPSAWS